MLLNEEQTRKLKETELEILSEIDRICRKNNIQYSLAFGTLIGAIRHKGFIPWDDDIDICMTRDNLNKFKSVLATDLDQKFFYIDHHINKHYGVMFGKVMKKDTLMAEVTTPRKVPSCIFVDVFVVDKTSLEQKKQLKQFKKIYLIRRLYLRWQFYVVKPSAFSRFLYRMAGIVLRLVPRKVFCKKYDKNCLRYTNEKDYAWILYGVTTSFKGAIFKKEMFEEYTDIEFEGRKFMSVKHYDEMLTSQYGDYMKLPPENQRFPQHVVEDIKF